MPETIPFIFSLQLFLRFSLGFILLASSLEKLFHLPQFQQGILNYKLIPLRLNSRLKLSRVLSISIPLFEAIVGLGLIGGFMLIPTIYLAIFLFVTFNIALIINLIRGRTDLSCNCGGILGNHQISWWLVTRNTLFITFLLILLSTPEDPLTIDILIRSHANSSLSTLVGNALPIMLIIFSVSLALLLINAIRKTLNIR